MSVRKEQSRLRKLVVTGAALASLGSAAVAANQVGAGDLVRFARPRRLETTQSERVFPISKDQLQNGVLFLSIGHSMLVPHGKIDPVEGANRKNTVDFFAAEMLGSMYPDIPVTHKNFAVIGSKNRQLLAQLKTNK